MSVFFRMPFVFITLLLLTGIIVARIGVSMDVLVLSSFCWIFISLVGLYIERTREFAVSLIFGGSFLFLGYLVFSLDNETIHTSEQELSNHVQIVHVQEVRKSESGWTRIKCSRIGSWIGDSVAIAPKEGILLMSRFDGDILPQKGDVVAVMCEFEKISNLGNPGEFDVESYWRNKRISFQAFTDQESYIFLDKIQSSLLGDRVDQVHDYLSKTLEDKFEGEELGIIKAMILGDKSSLDSEVRSLFSDTGAMHVLAVSGLHVGIVMIILMTIMSWFSKWIKRNTAIILVTCLLWGYALITGFSPSVLRSVFMFSILILAQLSGRQNVPLNTLFFSAFLLLLIEPNFLFDPGFQLSYLAMIGIFLLYPKIEALFEFRYKWMDYLWKGIAVGLAAQVFTTPLSLHYFHQFPNYFVLSNLGMMLLSGVLLGVGIAFLVLARVPVIATIVSTSLLLIVSVTIYFLQFIQELPGAVAYGFHFQIWVAIYLIILVVFASVASSKMYRMASIILIVFGFAVIQFSRWENLNSDQITVFNSSRPFILLKKGGINIGLYNTDDELAKHLKMYDNYRKIYPGKFYPIPVPKGRFSFSFNNTFFDLTNDKNGFLLKGDVSLGFVKTTDPVSTSNVVYAPWIQKQKGIRQSAVVLAY
ncbi:MAG: ComEC family competence protein [Bacteroidetes bacterium]|nr:MAG: ComEC family competence protein [Bacteroidota bacterium]